MTRGKPPTGYYTATISKHRLGDISDGKFRMFVEEGKIVRFVPPGSKQGFYTKQSVDDLAKELDGFPGRGEKGASFHLAKPDDMPDLVNLLIEIFGGRNTSEKRLKWMERNPEIAFYIRSKGQMVGTVWPIPMTEEKINFILNDQTPGCTRSIQPEDILPYVPGEPVSIYIASMGVKPGHSKNAMRARGSSLLRGMFKFLIDLGHRGIVINRIIGRTTTRDGVNILQHAGFFEVPSSTGSRNFVLDIEKSGAPHIMAYKRALKESNRR